MLIGTQMVAKGLDFPVRLVRRRGLRRHRSRCPTSAPPSGRSNWSPRWRAGPAAADVPGTAVVQTFASDLVAISSALKHDFERFAHAELASRQKMRFPPYYRLTRVLLEDKRLARVRSEAQAFVSQANALLADLPEAADLIGPQPAPIEKVRDRYRQDVLILR